MDSVGVRFFYNVILLSVLEIYAKRKKWKKIEKVVDKIICLVYNFVVSIC